MLHMTPESMSGTCLSVCVFMYIQYIYIQYKVYTYLLTLIVSESLLCGMLVSVHTYIQYRVCACISPLL